MCLLELNYFVGFDDIYVSLKVLKKVGFKIGDMVEGLIVEFGENERYFVLIGVSLINFEDLEKVC